MHHLYAAHTDCGKIAKTLMLMRKGKTDTYACCNRMTIYLKKPILLAGVGKACWERLMWVLAINCGGSLDIRDVGAAFLQKRRCRVEAEQS